MAGVRSMHGGVALAALSRAASSRTCAIGRVVCPARSVRLFSARRISIAAMTHPISDVEVKLEASEVHNVRGSSI